MSKPVKKAVNQLIKSITNSEIVRIETEELEREQAKERLKKTRDVHFLPADRFFR